MTAEKLAFSRAFAVSRETMDRLDLYIDLLRKWAPRINLVSAASLDAVWTRHVADSAQLWRYRPVGPRLWLDLGAGAGFPGVVIAALAADTEPGLEVRLVESDTRKAAFLTSVAHATGLPLTVRATRIENLPAQQADVVSARALAPLRSLLGMAEKHRRPGGIGLFPKGATVHDELAEAARYWRFDRFIHPSLTSPQAAVLEIGAIHGA